MHRYYFSKDEEDDQQEVSAQTAVILGLIQTGDPVIALNPEMIILARRMRITMMHLKETDGTPYVFDEHYDSLFPKLASFLIDLNREGMELFRDLDETQKVEARRIFQACLDMIDE